MNLLRGAFLAVLTAVFVAFVLGFFAFASAVRAEPPVVIPEADAIVALTGGSNRRLQTGMRLLEEGRGRRLLISGVDPRAPDADIHALLNGAPEFIDCCVDLGRSASDTLRNASETAAWARRNGFSTLIVVTADYHMPRSIAELRLALPSATLVPYPVRTEIVAPERWQSQPEAALTLAGEYVKFIIIRGRAWLFSPAPAERAS